MYRISLLIAVFFIIACGRENRYIDPRIRPVLDIYLKFAPNEGSLREVQEMLIEDLGNLPTESKCDQWDIKITSVTIKHVRRIRIRPYREDAPHYWQMTVLHELGHCLHDLKHVDSVNAIMGVNDHATPEREKYWKENLVKRLQEMFPKIEGSINERNSDLPRAER